MAQPLVAVFGSGMPREVDLERARALGHALGRAGYAVINGGYGGIMEASAAGAREAGGHAVGVTCALFTFRSGPNLHLDEVVEAPTLYARLETLIDRASGYVVLPGGVGTLIELTLTWEHLRRGLVPPRPLVVWEDPWRAVVRSLAEGPYAEEGHELLTWVSDVGEAVVAIREGVPVETTG
jgi:uncharacterized protein (TIGR00730 family)